MGKEKIAITLDRRSIIELDRMVNENIFQSRSQAIQEAVVEKLTRMKQSRLTKQCAKLNQAAERAISEEGLTEETKQWPEY